MFHAMSIYFIYNWCIIWFPRDPFSGMFGMHTANVVSQARAGGEG